MPSVSDLQRCPHSSIAALHIQAARESLPSLALASPTGVLDEDVEITNELTCICNMHLAKRLEFRAAMVVACEDKVIPLQQRVEPVTEEADIK